MFVEKMFGFAFGGKNDFGRMTETIGQEELDFSANPIGIGYAIRNGIEANMDNSKKISFCVKVDADVELDLTLEFKTKNSNGAPEVSKYYKVKEGVITITSPIPKKLSSPLEEIVIFFPRNGKEKKISLLFAGVFLN